jgi:hypothetical protein
MSVPAPIITWPTELREAGPSKDPAIMLMGDATIGGVAFKVTALRVREGLRGPDYHDDIPESAYEKAMDGMLDDIEDLVDSMEPERVVMNGAQYLLWIVPAGHD